MLQEKRKKVKLKPKKNKKHTHKHTHSHILNTHYKSTQKYKTSNTHLKSLTTNKNHHHTQNLLTFKSIIKKYI